MGFFRDTFLFLFEKKPGLFSGELGGLRSNSAHRSSASDLLGWWKRERFKGSWWPPTFGDEKVTVWIIRQFIICLIFVGLCLRLSQTYSQLKMASLNSRVTSNWSVLVEKNSPMGIFHMQKGSPGEKKHSKTKMDISLKMWCWRFSLFRFPIKTS